MIIGCVNYGSNKWPRLTQIIFVCNVFRLAQFFISPLLKEGSVEREIQAVESGKKNAGKQLEE